MSNKVYEIITDQIIKMLEKGDIPWQQPWITDQPKNLISKKDYRGINTFILNSQRYSSPYWLSYKQAQLLGGNVKKGEKSTMIVFWKPIKIDTKKKDNEETTEKTIPFLRYYRVFNIEQCENIDESKIPEMIVNPDFQPIEACETTIKGMQNKPTIMHREGKAYYMPSQDFVNMPQKETFHKEEYYYSVLFHELGHSTGHKSRLNRKDFCAGFFGSETYSKEELVAEMTAAFLCGHHKIEMQTIENSASYIKSWVKKFKNDSKMIVLAAAQAQKAADYILNKNDN